MVQKSNRSIDRRSVLKQLGTGSVIAIGATGTVSGQDSTPEYVIDPGSTFEPDVSGHPGVETAELTVHEASISTHVRLDVETLSAKGSKEAGSSLETHNDTTASGVSLSLDPDELPRPSKAGKGAVRAHSEREISDDLLQVEQSRRSSGDLTTHGHRDGMDDEPSTGWRDFAVYGQTESQECGPLARTSVLANQTSSGYVYNETADRESVDGNACRGHDWDAKFEDFCDYLGWIPGYDCGVPRVFDTSWHVEGTGFDSSSAQTVYACYDFPAVPDTVVAAHDVEIVDGPGVEFDHTVGVSNEDDISDYGWDTNGIANLIVDGIDTYLGTGRWSQWFTLAVGSYLLKSDDGVV